MGWRRKEDEVRGDSLREPLFRWGWGGAGGAAGTAKRQLFHIMMCDVKETKRDAVIKRPGGLLSVWGV